MRKKDIVFLRLIYNKKDGEINFVSFGIPFPSPHFVCFFKIFVGRNWIPEKRHKQKKRSTRWPSLIKSSIRAKTGATALTVSILLVLKCPTFVS